MNVKTFQDTRADIYIFIYLKSHLSHPQISKLWTALWALAVPARLEWLKPHPKIAKTSSEDWMGPLNDIDP
jgi:hypothetical protein